MAHPRAIDDGALRGLLFTLRDARLSWSTDEVPELARGLGWTIVDMAPGEGAVASADWDAGGNEILMGFPDERVDDITMRIADAVEAGQEGATGRSAAEAFLVDAFAAAVAATEDVLGPPTGRWPGDHPEVRWRRADHTARITRVPTGVNLVWANNEFQDLWDELKDEPE